MSRRERMKDFFTDASLGAASRAGGYLRAGPGGFNFEKILFYALILGGGFVLWKLIDTAKNPNKGTPYEGTGAAGTAGNVVDKILGGAPSAIGSAIGGKLADWFQKPPTEITTYKVQMPDGSYIALDSRTVKADGSFLRNNVRYRMAVDKSIVSGVNKFAVKL